MKLDDLKGFLSEVLPNHRTYHVKPKRQTILLKSARQCFNARSFKGRMEIKFEPDERDRMMAMQDEMIGKKDTPPKGTWVEVRRGE